MTRKTTLISLSIATAVLTGCVDAGRHVSELHSTEDRRFTLGLVQKEIRPGMTQGEVATALGSPNMVSTADAGRETWIYDKIATEASYSNSSIGTFGLGGVGGTPGSTLLIGIGGANYNKNAGASASTQKTLTVVIEFDSSKRVLTSKYHSSTF